MPVGLAWFSPDCTHFSRAKGGPPVRDVKRRDLAWVVVKWAEEVRPRVIILENVEEFQTWGPLDTNNRIIDSQKGATFRAWVKRLRRLGYAVEFQCLKACDYGAPTSRKRLFMIARCDGRPIVWPAPTHGNPRSHEVRSGQIKPWRTAAEIIDWSIPCPSIFDRKRPLAENTLKRIAEGIRRYVLETANPFIVAYYGPKREMDFRGSSLDEPIATQSTQNRFGLIVPTLMTNTSKHGPTSPADPIPTLTTGNQQYIVTPSLVNLTHGGRTERVDEPLKTITGARRGEKALIIPHLQRQFGNSIGQDPNQPLSTIMPGFGGKTALVTAFMAQHNGGMIGHEMTEPVSTLTHRGTQQQVVTSHIVKFKGTSKDGQDLHQPLHTIQTGQHYGEVRAFLMKYFGEGGQWSDCADPLHTITARDRMSIVTVLIEGEPYVIIDIGMRMLSPRELFLAQGFDPGYLIDVEIEGKKITKQDQVRLCGNSVSPDNAEALVRANLVDATIPQMKHQMKMFW
jgi:DNA (cytosine-5)-methyltransferase 1